MKIKLFIFVFCLIFLFGLNSSVANKTLMPDKWFAYCRHTAIFHAYTLKNYGYDVRLAVGLKWSPLERKWSCHTRAQVFNLNTGKWNWLCTDGDYVIRCYAEDRRYFRVSHYISFEQALKNDWNCPTKEKLGIR